MNKLELIRKTIRKGRGYKYHTYHTEYEDDIITLHHYGTPLIYFSVIKKLGNGLPFKIGKGWSVSDKVAISDCLRVIEESLNLDSYYYVRCASSYKRSKWVRFEKEILQENDSMIIVKTRAHNQYTLFNYKPLKRIKIIKQILGEYNEYDEEKYSYTTYDYGRRRRRGLGRHLLHWYGNGKQLKLIKWI